MNNFASFFCFFFETLILHISYPSTPTPRNHLEVIGSRTSSALRSTGSAHGRQLQSENAMTQVYPMALDILSPLAIPGMHRFATRYAAASSTANATGWRRRNCIAPESWSGMPMAWSRRRWIKPEIPKQTK
jgi:hypothetical protein